MSTENGNSDKSTQEKNIIRQVEYYFGDVNLAKDKFLREEIKKDKDGWVPMDTMLKFNRLKNLSEDYNVIATALMKSTAGLVQLNEDKTSMRRNPSQPVQTEEGKDPRAAGNRRSIYAKGFPVSMTLDEAQDVFDKHGQVEQISMRKDITKKFKGSVFVQFAKEEDADKFVKTPELKYNDTVLITMSKDDYFAKKIGEKKASTAAKNEKNEETKKLKEEAEQQRDMARMTRGAILHLSGLNAETTNLNELKTAFITYAGDTIQVAWVDYERKSTEAKVRFHEENSAATVLEKAKEMNGGKLMFNDTEITGRVLEGDEEMKHWNDFFRQRKESKENRGRRGGGGGGRGGFRGGRGGRGFSRGRKRSYHDSGAPTADKKAKVEQPKVEIKTEIKKEIKTEQ